MLDLAGVADEVWRPPVVSTVAVEHAGIDEVVSAIESHRAWLSSSGNLDERRAARLRDELVAIVSERVIERVTTLRAGADFERLQAAVAAREIDPWTAADELLAELS
jgi:LAO/AO transport system kinase